MNIQRLLSIMRHVFVKNQLPGLFRPVSIVPPLIYLISCHFLLPSRHPPAVHFRPFHKYFPPLPTAFLWNAFTDKTLIGYSYTAALFLKVHSHRSRCRRDVEDVDLGNNNTLLESWGW